MRVQTAAASSLSASPFDVQFTVFFVTIETCFFDLALKRRIT